MRPTETKLYIATLFFNLIIGTTLAVNSCFYCTPEDKGCDDPGTNHFRMMPCFQAIADDTLPHGRVLKQQRLRAGTANIEYMCATVQISNSNSSLNGLYRTCLVDTATDDCDLLKTEFEEQKFGKVLKCTTCKEDLCNNQTIQDFGKSNAQTNSLSVLLYTFFSFLFVSSVFSW